MSGSNGPGLMLLCGKCREWSAWHSFLKSFVLTASCSNCDPMEPETEEVSETIVNASNLEHAMETFAKEQSTNAIAVFVDGTNGELGLTQYREQVIFKIRSAAQGFFGYSLISSSEEIQNTGDFESYFTWTLRCKMDSDCNGELRAVMYPLLGLVTLKWKHESKHQNAEPTIHPMSPQMKQFVIEMCSTATPIDIFQTLKASRDQYESIPTLGQIDHEWKVVLQECLIKQNAAADQ